MNEKNKEIIGRELNEEQLERVAGGTLSDAILEYTRHTLETVEDAFGREIFPKDD